MYNPTYIGLSKSMAGSSSSSSSAAAAPSQRNVFGSTTTYAAPRPFTPTDAAEVHVEQEHSLPLPDAPGHDDDDDAAAGAADVEIDQHLLSSPAPSPKKSLNRSVSAGKVAVKQALGVGLEYRPDDVPIPDETSRPASGSEADAD